MTRLRALTKDCWEALGVKCKGECKTADIRLRPLRSRLPPGHRGVSCWGLAGYLSAGALLASGPDLLLKKHLFITDSHDFLLHWRDLSEDIFELNSPVQSALNATFAGVQIKSTGGPYEYCTCLK